jgi:hypothetical protein
MAKIKSKKKKLGDPKGKIKESVKNIRDECDDIEGNIEEDKDVDTHGDPCVDIYS